MLRRKLISKENKVQNNHKKDKYLADTGQDCILDKMNTVVFSSYIHAPGLAQRIKHLCEGSSFCQCTYVMYNCITKPSARYHTI